MSYFKVIFGLAAILVAAYYMSSPSKSQENTRSEKCGDKNNAFLEALEEDDYYGILDLKDDASMQEIRVSFRRLSRMHHPDKNLDDQEGATRRCAKVNRAYQTLSDETSRAEYDHMKKFKPPTQTPQHPGYYPAPPEEQRRSWWGRFSPFRSSADHESTAQPHDHDDGCVFLARWGICSAHLQPLYLPGLYRGMSDSPPGFFALYRFVFECIIAEDECKFTGRHLSSFPSFGYSDWPYNGPSVKLPKKKKKIARGPRVIKKDAKTFYDFWTTFSSRKDFGWAKVVDVDGVTDSTMKRFLEKENKILQNAARNDYNETVQNLAKHIRKIDPRCR